MPNTIQEYLLAVFNKSTDGIVNIDSDTDLQKQFKGKNTVTILIDAIAIEVDNKIVIVPFNRIKSIEIIKVEGSLDAKKEE